MPPSIFREKVLAGQCRGGNDPKLLAEVQVSRVNDDAHRDILPFFGGPALSALAFSPGLFLGNYGGTMMCQSSIYQVAGIVVGTVNGLQLNNWHSREAHEGGFLQLIAIFDKVN
jgi:hypothetical protein